MIDEKAACNDRECMSLKTCMEVHDLKLQNELHERLHVSAKQASQVLQKLDLCRDFPASRKTCMATVIP